MYKLTKSTNKKKKWMMILPDRKKIHFGQKGASDYTLHKDIRRKELYIVRHNNEGERGYWKHTKTNLYRPSYLSRYILWHKPSMKEAIEFIEKKQNIKINYSETYKQV